MLKIYGNPMSTCTRKVLMTLAETNTPFELTALDFTKGDHKQPSHIARQPFGRVPALDDDGFEMFESRAMCRYLSEKAGSKLVPTDAKTRAKMEQWISIETTEFSAHAMKFLLHHFMGRSQEPAVLEAAQKGVETACTVMEKQLTATPFLTGSELTLADICFMPYFEYAMNTPLKDVFAKYPHVMKWWSAVSDRQSWRKASGKAS